MINGQDTALTAQIIKIAGQFCDEYCKYRDVYKADESDENFEKMTDEVCSKCPIMRL